ncbi:MAG: hypothetical protein DLM69_01620 [Candidatus Chloroheliales bacterium]|nr:MAG: hypothetical protein DLM69_01620 [Chloroflexota bacterium]
MLLAAMAVVSASSGSPASAQSDSHYFPETGHTVEGRFLQYWQQHGGLAQQGYPISNELQERSDTDGKVYTVQYFERAVFELHPENQPPNDVLLSLLGSFSYKQKYPNGAPGQQVSTDNPLTFPKTGKTIGGKFRAYWESHSGLAQQGYPISNEFHETSTDSVTRTVQYFERAVFELHPENAGTPYEVLLTQLGTLRYHAPLPAEDLNSIDMVSPTEGWVVGNKGVILHYNGGRWQQLSSPVQGGYLTGVSMVSPDDGWAVGQARVAQDGVILHYSGGAWHIYQPPSYIYLPRLASIDMVSADEGWAVGGGLGSIILHYEGSKWSYYDSPHHPLQSVSMVSATEGWAVDIEDILHYDGSAWRRQDSPGGANSVYMLSASEGWAVGDSDSILHYSGGKWERISVPSNGSRLVNVYMVSPSEGWAVGNSGTILHYSGGAWSQYPSPTNKYLIAIKMVSTTEGWAVGEAGTILHYQNGTWSVYQQ